MKRLFFLSFFLLILIHISIAMPLVETIPEIAWQGKIIVIKITSAEAISQVKGKFLSQNFPLFKSSDDSFKGIIGIPIGQKPGYYNLNLIVTNKNGQVNDFSQKIKVEKTKFPLTTFRLKPSKDKLRSRAIIYNEWPIIEKNLLVKMPEQKWFGSFILPVNGRVSQGFGHSQIINGKRGGTHKGMDVAVPTGTRIVAPNDGKIVFTENMQAFGGTLVIDHGQGIQTLYFHLSKFLVNGGDYVKKGEPIALSGNSGISSGPHLHWGMSVHNLRVDPMQWVNYEI